MSDETKRHDPDEGCSGCSNADMGTSKCKAAPPDADAYDSRGPGLETVVICARERRELPKESIVKNCEHCGVIEGTPHDRACPEGKLLKMVERIVGAVTEMKGSDIRARQLVLVEAMLRQFRDEEVEWASRAPRVLSEEDLKFKPGQTIGLDADGEPAIVDGVDDVDNPQHYGGRDNPYEAVKVMLAWHGATRTMHFCWLTAEKYLARAGKKGEGPGIDQKHAEDFRKAAWYAKTAAGILEHGKVRP